MKLKKVVMSLATFTLFGTYASQVTVNAHAEVVAKQDTLNNVLRHEELTKDQKDFISAVYNSAVNVNTNNKVLLSVTLAQAILESGWGKSDLSSAPNYNLFGIKASADWTGETYTKDTVEMINNERVVISANFRSYNSYSDSITDYNNFFTSTPFRVNHYKAFLKAKDYKEALEKLGETGYATDKSYTAKLLRLIEKYRLYYLDGLSESLSDNNKNDDNNSNDSNVSNKQNELKEEVKTHSTGTVQNDKIQNSPLRNANDDANETNNLPKFNGLVNQNNQLIYFKDGAVDTSYTGLAQHTDKIWYYVKNGKVDHTYSGLVMYHGTWYNVNNGVLDWGYTSLVEYDGRWYYIKNGQLTWGLTALVRNVKEGVHSPLYYVTNSTLDKSYTGLVQHADKTWYYVKNGKVDTSYSGLVMYHGTWYNVNNGVLDWDYTSLVEHDGRWYYIKNGQLTWGLTALVHNVKEGVHSPAYYVTNSTLDTSYTGLVQSQDGTWVYVKNGKLDASYSGLVMYNGTWYNVNNGVLDWRYTSLVEYDGRWYYIKNGQLTWGLTALVRDVKADADSPLYYVTNSTLDTTYTGLAQYEDSSWYYVKNGKLDISYSGLVMYHGTWYNIVNGWLNWDYTGLVEHEGRWYYIKNGQLTWGVRSLVQKVKDGANSPLYYVDNSTFDSNYTGLMKHDNGTWYYIIKGVESKTFSGIVPYEGSLFYVLNGKIDWNFSGKVIFNGQEYNIENAKVVSNKLVRLEDRKLTRTVFIDPGHGGSDPGAVNGTLREKEQALLVSKKLKEKLESLGYTVVMSRMTDTFVGLRERSIMSNDSLSDIFISMHFNASGTGKAHGLETYWYNSQGKVAINKLFANDNYRLQESKTLATLIQNNIVSASRLNNRGVKRANFAVIRETAVPAILVEMGFIDNPNESKLIASNNYLELMADSIANAVNSYYKLKGK